MVFYLHHINNDHRLYKFRGIVLPKKYELRIILVLIFIKNILIQFTTVVKFSTSKFSFYLYSLFRKDIKTIFNCLFISYSVEEIRE